MTGRSGTPDCRRPGSGADVMSGRYLGVDLGSTTAKAVVTDAAGAILGASTVQMGAVSQRGIQRAVDAALAEAGVAAEDLTGTVATRYGRRLVPGTARTFTEITCHARGSPGARSLADHRCLRRGPAVHGVSRAGTGSGIRGHVGAAGTRTPRQHRMTPRRSLAWRASSGARVWLTAARPAVISGPRGLTRGGRAGCGCAGPWSCRGSTRWWCRRGSGPGSSPTGGSRPGGGTGTGARSLWCWSCRR